MLFVMDYLVMVLDLKVLLWGRIHPQLRYWLVFVGGYAIVIITAFLLALVVSGVEAGDYWSNLLYSAVLPFVVFWTPALVSAVNAYLRGGLAVSIAIGLTPALTLLLIFGVFTSFGRVFREIAVPTGDVPLWMMLGATAILGIGTALVGFLLGRAGKGLVETVVHSYG
jgi:hypothetical protein